MFERIPNTPPPPMEGDPTAKTPERKFEKRVSSEHLINRLENAVREMKQDGIRPHNPDWYKSIVQSIELIQNGEPIGHIGEDQDIYAIQGKNPLCTLVTVGDPKGAPSSYIYELENAVTVSEFGTGEKVLLTAPPEGWVEVEGSNGQDYAPEQ